MVIRTITRHFYANDHSVGKPNDWKGGTHTAIKESKMAKNSDIFRERKKISRRRKKNFQCIEKIFFQAAKNF